MIAPWLNAFALSGRVNIIYCGATQGAATLALGYMLHWAFSPPLSNPKLQSVSLLVFNQPLTPPFANE